MEILLMKKCLVGIILRYSHIAVILMVLPIQHANAMNFYKWKDARGNIHYSDVFPEEENITPLNFELPLINRIEHQLDIEPSSENKPDNLPAAKEIMPKKTLVGEENSHPYKIKCFSPSPKARGESLTKVPLTDEEIKNVRSIFDQLSGIWRGEGEELRCLGSIEKPEQNSLLWQTELEIKLRRSKELLFEMGLYESIDGISKKEIFEFFINDVYLAMSNAQSDKSVSMSVTDTSFAIWVEYFPVNGQHREMLRSVKLTNKKLRIEQYSFANSILTGSFIWDLSKR